MLTDGTLRELNDATARIPIADPRLPAVALELAQLARAAEAVRARLAFDAEPAAFGAELAGRAP